MLEKLAVEGEKRYLPRVFKIHANSLSIFCKGSFDMFVVAFDITCREVPPKSMYVPRCALGIVSTQRIIMHRLYKSVA